MVNIEQIQIGLDNYINNEILARTAGWNKFKYAFMKGAIMDKIPKILQTYQNNDLIHTLDIIDKNNMIDIDTVYKWAKNAVQKSGQFTIAGIILNESDIDKLYEYINQTASKQGDLL